jgi:hypothetical protein
MVVPRGDRPVRYRALAHLTCCAVLAAACGEAGLGVGHNDREPTCTKEHCDFDAAYIGGNLDLPRSAPVQLEVETCIDGVCEPAETFMLERAQHAARGPISVLGVGTCPAPPFTCGDTQKWWVGWKPGVEAADGGLAASYRIVIRDLDTGETLEDHAFGDPTYETVSARDCKHDESDGEDERVTCTHFIAAWD